MSCITQWVADLFQELPLELVVVVVGGDKIAEDSLHPQHGNLAFQGAKSNLALLNPHGHHFHFFTLG